MKNNAIRRLLMSGVLLSGLAACARSEPEAESVESNAAAEIVDTPAPGVAPVADAPAAPAPPSVEANAADDTPPDTAASPDEQMLDDASATGMTARASRGEEPAEVPAAGNETD